MGIVLLCRLFFFFIRPAIIPFRRLLMPQILQLLFLLFIVPKVVRIFVFAQPLAVERLARTI
jgi:hypothetical protein